MEGRFEIDTTEYVYNKNNMITKITRLGKGPQYYELEVIYKNSLVSEYVSEAMGKEFLYYDKRNQQVLTISFNSSGKRTKSKIKYFPNGLIKRMDNMHYDYSYEK
jgi:hypothetical protein